MKRTITRYFLCCVWFAVVGIGTVVLLNFDNAPGREGITPQRWPSDTRISLDPARFTLLMFAHPRCPCTRASIGELNRLLARAQGRIAAQVLFFKPSSQADAWVETDSWRHAAAIPGVSVLDDTDGALARRFGAETSGFVALFDPQGQLLFQGGITAGRGHAGDNAGANVIFSVTTKGAADLKRTPVYGCSLLDNCEAASPGVGFPPAGTASYDE